VSGEQIIRVDDPDDVVLSTSIEFKQINAITSKNNEFIEDLENARLKGL